ncbi:MAG: hypothetical protein JWQ09_3781 [Segetibacter sp.]|nr:hypothetical protein [Segetibacter sp.]
MRLTFLSFNFYGNLNAKKRFMFISGFTHFINSVELAHSRHVTKESRWKRLGSNGRRSEKGNSAIIFKGVLS